MTLFIMPILTSESINDLDQELGQSQSLPVVTAFVYLNSILVETGHLRANTQFVKVKKTEPLRPPRLTIGYP